MELKNRKNLRKKFADFMKKQYLCTMKRKVECPLSGGHFAIPDKHRTFLHFIRAKVRCRRRGTLSAPLFFMLKSRISAKILA